MPVENRLHTKKTPGPRRNARTIASIAASLEATLDAAAEGYLRVSRHVQRAMRHLDALSRSEQAIADTPESQS